MSVLCFALFACAFNLLIGYVGLLSFGHAAFFGGAAYVTAHAVKVWGLEPELGHPARRRRARPLLGLVIGFFAIRRQGIYFAMITLALAQMFSFICLQVPVHPRRGRHPGRAARLPSRLARPQRSPSPCTTSTLAIFLFGFFAIWRIVNSPFGNILKAIRENEQRAISLGYRVDRYKLGAFVMSAALAGLAGGTKAIVFQFATLTDVQWQMSGEVILMTLLGGIGTHGRPHRRRRPRHRPAELSRRLGLPGHRPDRHHLRDLRAALPPRHRRRGLRAVQAIGRDPTPEIGGSAADQLCLEPKIVMQR